MSFFKALLGGKSPSSEPNFFQRATGSTPKRRDSACSSASWESPTSSKAAAHDGYSWHCTLTNTIKHRNVNMVEEVDESRDYSKYPFTRDGEPVEIFIPDRRRATLQKMWDDQIVWDYYFKQRDPDDRPHDDEFHINTQSTDVTNPSWAFRYNFEKWNEYYKINRVVLQNFFSFLDYETAKMEMMPLTHRKDNIDGSGASGNMLTPPYSGQKGADGANAGDAEPRYVFLTQPTGHNYVPMEQFTAFDAENMDTMISLSGGRLERLAKLLSKVDFDTLVFNSADRTIFQRRPTLMMFWFLKLLPETVCCLHLENIVAELPIDLGDVLPSFFDRLWDISITLAKDRSAFTANEDIIMKWLETPLSKKKRSRFYFANCDFDINSMMKFIKAWRVTPEPHLFDNITIGRGSIPAMDFCRVVEDESWPFQHDWEVPYKFNYLGSKKTPYQHRQYIWKHKKHPAVLHYRFREGMLIFTAHQDHIEMLHRCCTHAELASVKRTCAMNPNDPHTLPYCAPHMTPLINLTDEDIEKGRTANYFYYRSTA